MSVMRNAYDALLVLPDGRGISPGETAAIDDEMLEAPGIVVWIDQGKLVDEDEPIVPQPEEPGTDGELPDIDGMDEAALTAELEAAGVDVDGRWGRDTLAEKVAELRAG